MHSGRLQPHHHAPRNPPKRAGVLPQVLKRVEADNSALQPRDKAVVDRVYRVSALLDTRVIALDPLIALFHQN